MYKVSKVHWSILQASHSGLVTTMNNVDHTLIFSVFTCTLISSSTPDNYTVFEQGSPAVQMLHYQKNVYHHDRANAECTSACDLIYI